MKLTKSYTVGPLFDRIRRQKEVKLFAEGWKVESEEFYKERDWGGTCCLAIIFLPLALLATAQKVKVVYSKD